MRVAKVVPAPHGEEGHHVLVFMVLGRFAASVEEKEELELTKTK